MRKLLLPLAVSLLILGAGVLGRTPNAYGQERAEPRRCAEVPGQTSALHRFRQEGETIEIVLRGAHVPASLAGCEPVSLDLHWSNGRNNGSNFNVTFLDDNNRPIFAKQISGFLSGVLQLPLVSVDQPVYGASLGLISVPTTVTIQAVRPFAAPANLSYSVTRVARAARSGNEEEGTGERSERGNGVSHETSPRGSSNERVMRDGNEIVSIHNAMRLIGASRLALVQIELKTTRPFPVKDVPLQLQIGKRVFVDELSGDYTGRKLTLSLTPQMFAELKDGDEIVAFFGKADGDVWDFGKLKKP